MRLQECVAVCVCVCSSPCLATSLVSAGKRSCSTEGLSLYEHFGETSLVIGLSR